MTACNELRGQPSVCCGTAYPQGGRIEREMPIHASNVMPLDSKGTPTRIGRKRIADTETGRGRWVRFAKTTGEELDH